MEKKSKQRRETGLGETEWPLDDYDDEEIESKNFIVLEIILLLSMGACRRKSRVTRDFGKDVPVVRSFGFSS